MSTLSGGPNIITDGLVLSLDAANIKSYVSGITTWTDLSRSGINGTLTNGPTFDSTNGGSIVFDGLDDYIELGSIVANTNNPLMLNGSSLTLSAFIKKSTGGDSFQRVIDKSTSSSNVGGYGMWVDGQQLGYSVNGNNWRSNSTTSCPLNVWNQITITATTSSVTAYVNGTLTPGGFYAGTFSTPPNTTTNLRIATWYNATGREFKGNIAYVSIYNRALSQQEILQNFNATRARFGI